MAGEKIRSTTGDLLAAVEDFKCHQCNCVSVGSMGLASLVFRRYPRTNTYPGHRTKHSAPGTADVFLEEGVVNLYAQYAPGPSKGSADTQSRREAWFRSALEDALSKAPARSTFAFPRGIGCGLAGGDWDRYLAMLREFANDPRVAQVVVYSLS